MKGYIAATHGLEQQLGGFKAAYGLFHIETVKHPGSALSSMKGPDLPSSLQAGTDNVVANTSCGSQNQRLGHVSLDLTSTCLRLVRAGAARSLDLRICSIAYFPASSAPKCLLQVLNGEVEDGWPAMRAGSGRLALLKLAH